MSKLLEIPYKNSIGQFICPGDPVISIASGYCHRVNVRKGVFIGVVGDSPSILIEQQKYGYYNDEGKDVGYSRGVKLKIKPSYRTGTRRSTLPLGRVYKLG